jgi:hypothetical protein
LSDSETIIAQPDLNLHDEAELTLPAEEGRGKRKTANVPPARFRDFVDSSLPELDQELDEYPSYSPTTAPGPSSTYEAPHDSVLPVTVKTTPTNQYGLYKRYQAPEEHPYEPEASPSSQRNLFDAQPESPESPQQANFDPFPNRNAFLLGEWRASDGNGKGRADFARLLEIISSPDWRPEDVRGVNWVKIDNILAEPICRDDLDAEWIEESAWRTSTVTINVPFNTTCLKPGPHPYEVQFRHRPIIPMIREKLMNLNHQDNFHFLPYELRWLPGAGKADVGVHGELYTSPAFLQAFQDLQVCLMRRVIPSVVLIGFRIHPPKKVAIFRDILWVLCLVLTKLCLHSSVQPNCGHCTCRMRMTPSTTGINSGCALLSTSLISQK